MIFSSVIDIGGTFYIDTRDVRCVSTYHNCISFMKQTPVFLSIPIDITNKDFFEV